MPFNSKYIQWSDVNVGHCHSSWTPVFRLNWMDLGANAKIRYQPDSPNFLIPKFESNQTSSSRDTAIFVVFYTLGTKKHEKVGYLWNYSSDPAQILGSSSRDCPTCTLWCASTPKSIAFNGKTGVQLEWQCPTFASLSCISEAMKDYPLNSSPRLPLHYRNLHCFW